MAQKKNGSGKGNTGKKTTSGSRTPAKTPVKTSAPSGKNTPQQEAIWKRDILFLVLFAAAVLLLLSDFGLCGTVGRGIRFFLFGMFGCAAYAFPFVLFAGSIYYIFNRGKKILLRPYIGLCGLFLLVCALLHVITVRDYVLLPFKDLFLYGPLNGRGGGLLGGSIVRGINLGLGNVGTIVVLLVGIVIFLILMTARPLVSEARKKGTQAIEDAREKARQARERREERRRMEEEAAAALEDEETLPVLDFHDLEEDAHGQYSFTVKQEKTNKNNRNKDTADSRPSVDNRVTGTHKRPGSGPEVTVINRTDKPARTTPKPAASLEIPPFLKAETEKREAAKPAQTETNISGSRPAVLDIREPEILPVSETVERKTAEEGLDGAFQAFNQAKAGPSAKGGHASRPRSSETEIEEGVKAVEKEISTGEKAAAPRYELPPLSLLNKGSGSNQKLMNAQVEETARRLQQTLDSFGVAAKVVDYSCGPTVTRYELAPEEGVKVSRIVGLADDIKLNLATADIRIEAPIPGKAAVGIEVPNKTNASVALSDLLRSPEFQNFKSKLAFAVGVDLAGQIVVTDIAKMPHLLIAGATGSGKSVCINTLILSLLYKATPDEVKLLMIDPKVVEMQIFNDIPHLLIPVVTDPKKAAGALNWAVAEMTRRYNIFAEFNVKDLSSYNDKAKSLQGLAGEGEKDPEIMPQIVVIIDELADLMMVSPGEVQDAIVRLTQLARAAGIHLIIATQRPSVNVITGLIKANMPSRIALSVTSGIDSRVILDMTGAEKLLGKGDMLFYPQGYSKPARVQGAFISDEEILRVVEFLKGQRPEEEPLYDSSIQMSVDTGTAGDSQSAPGEERDVYFAEAGKFIIEKDKASIGMLQRMFKIGFNRAARIMDQLCEAGVVGEEEGTKPRKILMTAAEFDAYIEENR